MHWGPKKFKSLGLVEDSLNEVDIFINSLTSAEHKLGKQYGIILNQDSQTTTIDKLKKMELHHCKVPIALMQA